MPDAPADLNYSNWEVDSPFYMNSSHSAMDNFCGSRFWDPNVTWYTETPNFTSCFQLTVLVWLPCAFLWLLGPIEAFMSARSSARGIPWTWLNLSRLGLAGAMCLVSAADTGFESRQLMAREASHTADYVAPAIRMVTFGLAAMLGVWHRSRGRRSSPVLWIFWLLLTVCGVPQLHDDLLHLNTKDDPVFRSATFVATWCATLLQLLLAFFADAAPREPYLPEQENPCPEEGASFPSRLVFSWCTGIVWRGFRRPLDLVDLWALRPQDTTREVFPPFRALLRDAHRKPRATNGAAAGARAANAPDKPEVTSVLPALVRCFGPFFLVSSVIRVGQMCLRYSAPSLLSLLIQFASSNDPAWRGIFYAVLLMVVANGEMLLFGAQNRITKIVSMRVNTALVAAIYKKALRLSSASRRESTAGEIVNLMSVDARRFVDVCAYLNLAWSSPVEIGIVLALLWMQLGLATLAGMGAVLLLLLPLSVLLMRRLESLEGRQMKHKDARIKMMTEILAGIRVLKLYAWEPSFEERVQHVRAKEQSVLRTRAVLDACISLIWVSAPTAVAVITFATYLLTDRSRVLDAEKAFVSLALVNMLRSPLLLLPHLIVSLVQVKVSLGRINKFINAEELDPSSVTHDYSNPLELSVVDGDFSWAAGEPPTLHKVQLGVRKSQLTAVVGPVGAGKSSLLAALLGEMYRINGRVNTKGTIAYVPQQAWMQNATLQDNILFGLPLDADRYERVIDACALRPDLEMLPAGDRTEIGEKGINLSGGQKQRVSLARAVYADADVYLLDDPLSAVDSHVGKHLFQEVIGPTGLLKRKTRVLVTHAVTYLPETNQILVLKDGRVSESGSYADLLEQGGAFADFLQQHAQEGSEQKEGEENDDEVYDGKASFEGGDLHREFKRLVSRTSRVSRSSVPKLSMSESEAAEAAAEAALVATRDKAGERLIEEEHIEKGRVSRRVYWLYLRSMGARLALATLAANIVYQVFALGSGAWLARWSSSAHFEDPSFYIGVYAALGLGLALGSFLTGLAPQLGGWRAACLLHGRLLQRVMRAPLSFFDTTPAGRIVARFGKDVDELDNSLPGELDGCVTCSFEVLSILLIICYSTPIFLAAVGPIIIIYIFIQQVYISTARQMFRLESTTRSPVYSHFGETIAGATTIRAFGRQKDFERESEIRVDTNQRCFFAGLMTESWMEIRVELVGNVVVFLAALFSALGRGQVTPGLVGLSISFSLQVTAILNWLVQIMSLLEKSIVSVERVEEYSNVPQEAPWERPSTRDLTKWPEQGEVCFDNLQLRYREGLDLVLHGISFCARPGEKVGIVGRTGAGKSSLTLALFRLVEAAGGRVAIDGVDAAQLGLHALRSRLTIIPQEPVLFSGTLRLNLDPFERHSDAQLWRALEMAHLRAFVDGLPEGLSHQVSEGGDNLSVGQRQLVCLARALLRKSKVLVLDEATAAVDLETDDLIQRTIRSEFSECTVLTIAHRINTIMDCDRVLVLSQGKVVEFDPPQELLKRPDSAFAGMARDAGLA